ncbi:MAG: type II toxin-antitoxin system PemK/MazF family toxin [Candidatus Xenobiia bacterium LiM19]
MVAGYPQRGQIWNVYLDPVKGSEIGKTRPALVISNDRNNEFAETVTVIPITSSVSRIYPFEALLTCSSSGLKNDSKAKCNQIRTVSKERLLNMLGAISSEELREVEKGLLIHLGYETV